MLMRWWNIVTVRDYTVIFHDTISSGLPHPIGLPGPGTNEIWTGGSGDDTHNGTNTADTLDGAAGNDTINGLGGPDVIYGGIGNDSLYGGNGNDTVHAGSGTDPVVDAGAGNDTIVIDSAGGVISNLVGGDGIDTVDATAVAAFWQIDARSGIEHWILSNFGETFTGDSIDETWDARGGNDVIDAAGGDDTMYGGVGNYTLTGNVGDDQIYGGDDDDSLVGDAGADTLDGGNGNDTIYYSFATGAVRVNLATGVASGADGHDMITNVESVVGSGFNDTITGNAAGNQISGLVGDDVLDGAGGVDWVYYNQTNGDVAVNLLAGSASGALGNDTLRRIENIVSGGGNDTLTGSNGANTIYGGNGNDTIDARKGDDFLIGDAGNDTLTPGGGLDTLYGGAGADVFKFGALAPGNIPDNFIEDLDSSDQIDLSGIDANVIHGGNQAFRMVGHLNGHAAQAVLLYDSPSNQTFLVMDTDGDGNANFRVVMPGDHTSFTNIIL